MMRGKYCYVVQLGIGARVLMVLQLQEISLMCLKMKKEAKQIASSVLSINA
jgi:hypothetical protein